MKIKNQELRRHRQMDAIRRIYRNMGYELTDGQVEFIAYQQDERNAIWGGVIRILIMAGALVFLIVRFWPF